ncbi:zona pellucida sperm-binding protein 4-like [Pseudoliparis swirei]|uniref:zona pellucida sperm-binding protein 4-like n=1 Tax=Pseudoliparis swirei TaxID=2059687 RepID=UPI0024BE84FC|nr:zona pellucida sperm-binding protein 4-like [Pseudoliparis swirei]
MELFKCLFSVAVVAGLHRDVSAQHYWTLPQQTLPAQRQLTLPQPEAPYDKCLVEQVNRIQCGSADATADHCENINCCFDDDLCYYGKAVTVQCTRDGQFVVVMARDSTLPNIDVESVSLLETDDPSCSPIDITSSFVIFQFSATACGTTVQEEDGYVVYENHMSSSYEVGVGPRGSITRDSHFELLFQCRYSDTAVEAVVMAVNAVPPPVSVAAAGLLRVELRLGNGQCLSNGCVEEDAAYSSFYNPSDYPITKVLREPVYVEVNIVGRSDSDLVLNMEHCWATASPNPQSMPQWDLLVDGCPYHDDRYLTTVVPVDSSSGLQYPSHYKRFIVKMFTFVDQTNYSPQKDTVFFHCATEVCYPSTMHSCDQQCHRQRRAVPAVRRVSPSSQRDLVSSGEMILTEQRPPAPNAKSDQ